MTEKKYNYFYKITNNLNGHYYYGVHCTNDLDDGYMGSGKRLHWAYEKYGIENFTKEILKFFENKDSAFQYEYDYITEEMVKSSECYNIQGGGRGKNSSGCVNIIDENGIHKQVSKDDPKWLDGTYRHTSKNKIWVLDTISNNYIMIQPEKHTYELSSGVYIKGSPKRPYRQNKSTYVDSEGNTYYTTTDDPRVLSGELFGITTGKTLSDEHKKKIKEWYKNNDTSGKNNSQYGWKCFYKEFDGKFINKRVPPDEIEQYVLDGWIPGKKLKTDEEKRKRIRKRVNSKKVCKICGNINCHNPFCKVHNRILHLQHLVKFFDYDESKIGTSEAESEFNRIKNNLLTLRNQGKSNKEILDLYGNKTSRLDRTWKILDL